MTRSRQEMFERAEKMNALTLAVLRSTRRTVHGRLHRSQRQETQVGAEAKVLDQDGTLQKAR
jgi:hypothetical protein